MDKFKFHLNRMGSDPEALFVKPIDFDWTITPAYEILGRDKAKTTHSFIGTDSRPVLMEIRPNPTRNLKQHLYEIAYALNRAQEYLDQSTKFKGLQIMAYPHLLGENLGGHIHVSGFLRGPIYEKMKEANFSFQQPSNPGFIPYNPNVPIPKKPGFQNEIVEMMQEGSIVHPMAWAQIMHYMLEPFEKWIMPWVPREQRNGQYGGPDHPDVVRLGVSKPPKYPHKGLYVHWEYRMPSSWLQHPWLAFAYLGLAKLIALNTPEVAALVDLKRERKDSGNDEMANAVPAGGGPVTTFHAVKGGDPTHHGKVFRERLARVMTTKPRFSNDIKGLLDVVMRCGGEREAFFNRPKAVNIAAWRRLLG